MDEKKRRGRPRIHKDDSARVKAWREEKKHSGRRIDAWIDDSASWRIVKLAKAWKLPVGKAVERLILEADKEYLDILFPDTEITTEEIGKK